MTDHIKKTARYSIIIFIFIVITGLTGYFIRISLARNLSVGEYGLFYSVLALFGFFSIFVDFGLAQGTINRLVEYRVDKKFGEMKNLALSILYLQLIIAAILSLVLILLQKFLSEHYYKIDISSILFPLCLYFVTLPIILFITNMIYSFGKSVFQSALDTIKNVFILIVILSGLYLFNLAIKAPAYAYALSNIFALIIFVPVFFKLFPDFFKLRFRFDFPDVWRTFKYGIFVTLATMGWVIITQTDTLMLTYFSGLEKVGIYQVAVPIATVLLFFAHALGVAIYPLFSEFQAKKEFNKMSELTSFIYSYIEIVVIPVAIVFLIYPDFIIRILFGSKFLAGTVVVQIFAVLAPFITLGLINYTILAAIGKARRSFKIILMAAVLNILLNLVLIPRYDIAGAAIASVLSFSTVFIFSIIQLQRIYSFVIPYWKLSKIFFCSLFFLASIYLLKKYLNLDPRLEIFLVLIISGLIYLLLLVLTKIMTKESIINMKSILKVK